jgi:hypothetical protein
MKRNLFTTGLILCCFAAVCIAAVIADLNGKFSGTITAPDGNQHPLTYTFKVDGDKLTGTLDTEEGSVPIDSGKVSGDNMAFSVTVDGMAYAHKGKYYAQGDSVALDVNFGGAKVHATLQRAK